MTASPRRRAERQHIGWREWVSLPDFGVLRIKAKVDTGARTSTLHAFGLELFDRNDDEWARFSIHPRQRSTEAAVTVEAPVSGWKRVRSSNGQSEHRPVLLTPVGLLGREWPIELTLSNRDQMGFRMLLGRQAVRRRFLVDPGRSYVANRRLPGKVPT
ncbi:MAG: ATP-dependent zinc protease [Thermoleophilia bacterium]|nr:ATP-dependent zinc protease [Thermoleophilia bacterium]